MADINIGSLYDANKALIAREPRLSREKIQEKMDEIQAWVTSSALFEEEYYMLLCNDRRDYTVFSLKGERASHIQLIYDLEECLRNRGYIMAIEEPSNGAMEIWLKIDDEIYCYYFFPCKEFIIEVSE
jgi:hypothetical protein